jgi:methionyl-tRNA synthetase
LAANEALPHSLLPRQRACEHLVERALESNEHAMNIKRTLVTSALPYANGYLHLGHAAGSFLPADLYVRFMRLAGERVLYICGSDEYGVAISIAAEKAGVTPREIIDQFHTANAEALNGLGMSFDLYSRTSLPVHIETTQEFFTDLLEKGFLAEKEEAQFYDDDAQMFLPDRYVEGTCPNCGYDRARGDQCDNCGAYYNQLDLKNPRSLVSGKTPVVKNTTHWYFKLGDFQEWLEGYIGAGAARKWKDNVVQQSQSWLKQGLGDRAITRDLTWGVPVPLERAKGKVIYVWFDAVLGYISITKEWARLHGTPEAWKEWWLKPQDGSTTDYVAFLGKDNIVFHTIMFPAMLQARGNYVLPTNVPANEFLNLEGQKFSKSRNWAIDVRDYLAAFPEPHQADALRYTLAMNMPETKDADFTWKDFQARVNNELAAIVGNFVNRTAQFLQKNFGGNVPILRGKFQKIPEAWKLLVDDLHVQQFDSNESAIETLHTKYLHYFSADDVRVLVALVTHLRAVEKNYRAFRFRDAVAETMNIARAANKYFNDAAPWKSVKEAPDECAKTLYICSQLMRSLGYAFAPVIPNTAQAILTMLNAAPPAQTAQAQATHVADYRDVWKTLSLPQLPEGTALREPTLLFSKMEDSTVQAQVAKLGSGATTEQASEAPPPPKTASKDATQTTSTKKTPNSSTATTVSSSERSDNKHISIDEFGNVQLRTGVILEASRVPKSDKLLKLLVNVGTDAAPEHRQILSGIAKYYTPEEMVGKTVTVVVNLKPAKLMGLESQGMILSASTEDGALSLVVPENSSIGGGAEVR